MSEKYPDGKNLKSATALANRHIKEGKQSRVFQAILTLISAVEDRDDETAAMKSQLRDVQKRLAALEGLEGLDSKGAK